MEEKGFIVRESVPEDARLKKLVLTPEAIEISKGMEADRDAIERQITKGFSEKELQQFYSYIERIRKNVTDI